MPVSLAFLIVVLVWSSTPLGIVWSSESIDPNMALLLRSLIGLAMGLLLMKFLAIKLDFRPIAIKLYAYSSLNIFWGTFFCYLAAQHISSGLIALVFGLAPIFSGILAQKILSEGKFTGVKKIAFVVALVGLTMVCWQNISAENDGLLGIVLAFISVSLLSLCNVMVKSVPVKLHPLTSTIGTLIFCLPFYLVSWWLMGAKLNIEAWQPKAIGAVVYLGVLGSLVGFWLYFYILQKLEASTVGLVTLITPVLSVLLGIWLNNEPYGTKLLIGSLLVMSGLSLFQFGHKLLKTNPVAIDR